MTSGSYCEKEQKEQMDFAHQEEMIKQLKALLEEDVDYIEKGMGRKIAAGFIIIDDIPGLSCPDKYFAVKEGVGCYPCIRVGEFEGGLKVMKNKFGISDFPGFAEAWKAGDKKTVPLYLGYVHNAFGCNVTATTTHSNDMIALPLGLLYAAIHEMHLMKLEDITNEDVMRKWGCVMRDAKKMGLDVEFAEEHLKKIAHAYFQLPELDVAREHLKKICSISETESFEDGAPLTKGLLLFARGEQSA